MTGEDAGLVHCRGHKIHSLRDSLPQVYPSSFFSLGTFRTTKKGQAALLLLLSWSFPVSSVAYHKHPHLFYGVVLTAFLGGESSSTVRSWALCGLHLPLSLKNFRTHGKQSHDDFQNAAVSVFFNSVLGQTVCSSPCGSLLMFPIFIRSFLVKPTQKPKFLMEFRSIYLFFFLLVLPTNKIRFKNKNKNGNTDILEKLE